MKKKLKELKTIIRNKKIYIWGAMIVGQGICRALERYKITIEAFLDSSKSVQGKTALGYPILSAQTIIKNFSFDDAIIIISSGHYDLEIERTCIREGLKKNIHYMMSVDLNDVDPSIDVAGTCNLRCISCPHGNMLNHHPVGFMDKITYQKVLHKLLDELPFLGSIQLYTWGEPLLNRNLAEIISITKQAKVLAAISSNLNVKSGYKNIIKAKLDWFKISASGFGKSYELTHTGGNWDQFLKNLYKIADLREKYHPQMQVLLNYHLYKHNRGEDYFKMEDLCKDLDFIFRPSPAYLYPLDNIKDYLDGIPLSLNSQKTLDLLYLNLDDGIKKALVLKKNRCPEERCLPISWDKKVLFCGVYYKPFICDDFLLTPLEEILTTRYASKFCQECKAAGLHQFTAVYLAENTLKNGKTPIDT